MQRVCIIGAGPSGITAAKNLLQVGITNFIVYEMSEQVGGNWVFSKKPTHSSVFDTTHIISSKRLSHYEGYPMPADYPDYPNHRLVLKYFQNYAKDFGVEKYIQFQTRVEKAEKRKDGRWDVYISTNRKSSTARKTATKKEVFDYLIVANGHHWDPRRPDYPGKFTGKFIHSHEYKEAEPFKGKKVLVIGGGNSACDIAVETARVSKTTSISMRRGYYFVPKFFLGLPADVLNARVTWLPRFLRLFLLKLVVRFVHGKNEDYGLQPPDHKLLESHPVANSELLYFVGHGEINPRVDIEKFEGKKVHFKDGTIEEYDVIIAATGFRITFPFFDKKFIDFDSKDVPLYLRIFHPKHSSLAFVGLFQPIGCIWPLSDLQAKLVANLLAGNYSLPEDMEKRIEKEVKEINNLYMQTPRHTVEVDYHDFRKQLLKEIPCNAPEWPAHSVQRSASNAQAG